ncbi:MAG TPA: hypothetical protein VNZ64_18185 [Candidatus Acidoferrum sp.]|jgi:hypothetical protein|nr:hypothetical protein [Candidatus Acidoferrum sp.]
MSAKSQFHLSVLPVILIWHAATNLTADAQRSFSIAVAATNQNGAVISWQAQSATPVGDLILVPEFQLQRSSDFKTWSPIGSPLTGTPGQTLAVLDAVPAAVFYRVESIISLEYAELSNA